LNAARVSARASSVPETRMRILTRARDGGSAASIARCVLKRGDGSGASWPETILVKACSAWRAAFGERARGWADAFADSARARTEGTFARRTSVAAAAGEEHAMLRRARQPKRTTWDDGELAEVKGGVDEEGGRCAPTAAATADSADAARRLVLFWRLW
jgi:hypothetical protein